MSSISEYYGLTPQERAAWNKHLQEYPPGDWNTQRLLAILCSMVASIGGGKSVKPNGFAPWLHWPEPETAPVPFSETLEGKAMNAILDAQIAEREQSGQH